MQSISIICSKRYREAFKTCGPKIRMGHMQKKHGLANAEKTWVGQCRKACLDQCRKTNSKVGDAKRRPFGLTVFLQWPRHVFSALAKACFFCIGQPKFFLHWLTHVFSAFGPSLFFGLWPMLVFLALAHAYFIGFGPRYFLLAVAGAGPRYF